MLLLTESFENVKNYFLWFFAQCVAHGIMPVKLSDTCAAIARKEAPGTLRIEGWDMYHSFSHIIQAGVILVSALPWDSKKRPQATS